MVRAFLCFALLWVCVVVAGVVGSHFLHRRWDRKGFYE